MIHSDTDVEKLQVTDLMSPTDHWETKLKTSAGQRLNKQRPDAFKREKLPLRYQTDAMGRESRVHVRDFC